MEKAEFIVVAFVFSDRTIANTKLIVVYCLRTCLESLKHIVLVNPS